jgi:hypothetical protein
MTNRDATGWHQLWQRIQRVMMAIYENRNPPVAFEVPLDIEVPLSTDEQLAPSYRVVQASAVSALADFRGQKVAGELVWDGIGLFRRGRCSRLRRALGCLRPSKVHPEWIRRAFQSFELRLVARDHILL